MRTVFQFLPGGFFRTGSLGGEPACVVRLHQCAVRERRLPLAAVKRNLYRQGEAKKRQRLSWSLLDEAALEGSSAEKGSMRCLEFKPFCRIVLSFVRGHNATSSLQRFCGFDGRFQ